MTFAETLVEYFNRQLRTLDCLKQGRICGIAETVDQDGNSFPVWNKDGTGIDIKPDNGYPIQIYWRVADQNSEVLEEGFGENQSEESVTLTLFGIGKRDELQKVCGLTNEGLAQLIAKQFKVESFGTGRPEVWNLTFTGGSDTVQATTITLNGISYYNLVNDNGGSIPQTITELIDEITYGGSTYYPSFPGWRSELVGTDIIQFTSNTDFNATGAFQFVTSGDIQANFSKVSDGQSIIQCEEKETIVRLSLDGGTFYDDNATIVLNGESFTVPLTNAEGSNIITLIEIAAFNFPGWQVGLNVSFASAPFLYFSSLTEVTGAFSFSFVEEIPVATWEIMQYGRVCSDCYHSVNLDSDVQVNTDKRSILSQEFPGFEFAPHILDMVAFSVQFNITGISCPDCC